MRYFIIQAVQIKAHKSVFLSTVLNMEDRIGNFEIDKEFDALLIDVTAPGSAVDIFSKVSLVSHCIHFCLKMQLIVYSFLQLALITPAH